MAVLDLCAAPGGKALLLASDHRAMNGTGRLLAVDTDFIRLQRLAHNARLQMEGPRVVAEPLGWAADALSFSSSSSPLKMAQRIKNVTVFQADGRFLQVNKSGEPVDNGGGYDSTAAGPSRGTPSAGRGGPFDRVLVDAPCTGSGSFDLASIVHTQPDAVRWRRGGSGNGQGGDRMGLSRDEKDSDYDQESERGSLWSRDLLIRQSRRQKQLLWNAAVLLRPGGSLIYSTCSLSPEENEEVVSHLLDNMPHQMKLCPVGISPAFLSEFSWGGGPAGDSPDSGHGMQPAFGVRLKGAFRNTASLAKILTSPPHQQDVGITKDRIALDALGEDMSSSPIFAVHNRPLPRNGA